MVFEDTAQILEKLQKSAPEPEETEGGEEPED